MTYLELQPPLTPKYFSSSNSHQLMGRGISYIDTHLLAATALSEPARLWTRDKRLLNVAAALNLAYNV